MTGKFIVICVASGIHRERSSIFYGRINVAI
jgi:hypothetical protein